MLWHTNIQLYESIAKYIYYMDICIFIYICICMVRAYAYCILYDIWPMTAARRGAAVSWIANIKVVAYLRNIFVSGQEWRYLLPHINPGESAGLGSGSDPIRSAHTPSWVRHNCFLISQGGGMGLKEADLSRFWGGAWQWFIAEFN